MSTCFKPINMLDDLCDSLKDFSYELHDFNGNAFNKTNADEVRITIINPYSSMNMDIDIDDGFTVFYDGYHSHYFADIMDYSNLKKFLKSFFENQICYIGMNYGDNKKWLGETSITKEQSENLDIKSVFSFVLKHKEFVEKINRYGGEVCCSFWNPVDNYSVKIEGI